MVVAQAEFLINPIALNYVSEDVEPDDVAMYYNPKESANPLLFFRPGYNEGSPHFTRSILVLEIYCKSAQRQVWPVVAEVCVQTGQVTESEITLDADGLAELLALSLVLPAPPLETQLVI